MHRKQVATRRWRPTLAFFNALLEGLEKRCVACNSFNYAWDDEWNAGMMRSALAGENVESGLVALRVPERAKQTVGGSASNTINLHDDAS